MRTGSDRLLRPIVLTRSSPNQGWPKVSGWASRYWSTTSCVARRWVIRWHRTTIAAANPPAREPCRLPRSAKRHILSRCRHLNRAKMAGAIRRTAAKRAPPPTGRFGQSPVCAAGGW